MTKEGNDLGRAGRASRLQKWMELSQKARQDLDLPSAPDERIRPLSRTSPYHFVSYIIHYQSFLIITHTFSNQNF